jgi:cytochrome b involved in lipid metabolism
MSNRALYIFISIVLVAGVALGAFVIFGQGDSEIEETSPNNENQEVRIYTLAEIEQEYQATGNCILAVEGKVYDVTDYIGSHPGGDEILRGCGTDATELFINRDGQGERHSGSAFNILESFYIGELQ